MIPLNKYTWKNLIINLKIKYFDRYIIKIYNPLIQSMYPELQPTGSKPCEFPRKVTPNLGGTKLKTSEAGNWKVFITEVLLIFLLSLCYICYSDSDSFRIPKC